ncbi:MAG: metallophosphoesterase [Deltaproteobacteria bacterium]|jgi:predicted MPP superfamily phosphohydrolase|nr:metallophosphoesterase [Deltaproteobacteria bacterium]
MMILAVLAVLAFSFFYTSRIFFWLGAWRWWPLSLLALAWTLGYLALVMTGAYAREGRLYAILFVALGLLFMFWVYLFLLTAAFDLIGLLAPKRIPRKACAVAALALAAGLVVYGHLKARDFAVTRWEIEVPGLAAPVTLVHAPDVHLGPARGAAYLDKVLSAINSLAPDFVLYNGDLVDGNQALSPEIFDKFKKVKARQYFTTGNHEYYVNTPKVLEMVENAGIKVLSSERAEESGLNLVGLAYMNADRETNQGHRVNDLGMDRELPKIARDPALPDLLVHHSPVGLKYADREGFEVMLAGHTHGGQVFPGNLLIRLNFPYVKGRYDAGGVKLLVSQGVGTFGPVARLGTESELQFIRLVPAPAQASLPRSSRPTDDRQEPAAASKEGVSGNPSPSDR